MPANATAATANQDYAKITDPHSPVPSAPVYAARLNGLMNKLASAEGAVTGSVRARRGLIDALEKLLDENRAALGADEEQLETLSGRKSEIEQKKQDVETSIMQGLSIKPEARNSPEEGPARSVTPTEPDRPEMEALTPPSVKGEPNRPEMEALTPPSVKDEPELPEDDDMSPFAQPAVEQDPAAQQNQAPGIEMLSNLASQYQSLPVVTNGSNKRRRLGSDDEDHGMGGDDDGIDPDVAEMLRKDNAEA